MNDTTQHQEETPFQKTSRWLSNRLVELSIVILLCLTLVLISLPHILISIDSGEEGVLWSRFFGGTQLDETYGEGIAIIFPWDKMTIYNMRLQKEVITYQVLSENGLNVEVEISIRFSPYSEHLAILHQTVGPDYIDIVMIPDLGGHVRSIIAQYEPQSLYSIDRTKIQNEILESIRSVSSVSHSSSLQHSTEFIYIDDLLIKNVALPEAVSQAIESKERAKQEAMAYEHKIEAAEQEKTRKRIEAEGIRDFQQAIATGMTDKYLKWKGINATLELATSNNAKVVIIGSGEEGLPIILGGDYTSSKSDADELTTLTQDNRSAEEALGVQSESYSTGGEKLNGSDVAN
ncbi:MAG: prohibitin family protein [Gammaproteobacteria bacterium]|nr:prohibitin family protein [Gammaproteobacteria bacterium]DAC82002.1 TPA_exp: MycQ [uncultured Gammaproteobacteria bacterium]